MSSTGSTGGTGGTGVLRVAVGTTNPAKLRAVEAACTQIFLSPLPSPVPAAAATAAATGVYQSIEVVGISVPSGVRDQPLSDAETQTGALTRARAVLAADPTAHYGVGVEGGAQETLGRWFESGWICVVDRSGRVGLGTSGRYELSAGIMKRLLAGEELAQVIDDLSGLSDVRSTQGAMGLVTNGLVPRDTAYVHGVLFAFAPFVSSPALWQ
ncbi:hypothetical protein BC831DRAFT_454585 [Entophlyctis helioformis]|nr:hypothetical protein BC831DRAFT_454585 [Entophlyctis helioformis]